MVETSTFKRKKKFNIYSQSFYKRWTAPEETEGGWFSWSWETCNWPGPCKELPSQAAAQLKKSQSRTMTIKTWRAWTLTSEVNTFICSYSIKTHFFFLAFRWSIWPCTNTSPLWTDRTVGPAMPWSGSPAFHWPRCSRYQTTCGAEWVKWLFRMLAGVRWWSWCQLRVSSTLDLTEERNSL